MLYLRGLSTGDFWEAPPALVEPEAAGLSATSTNRLIRTWQEEYRACEKSSLAGKDYVYLWADEAYFRMRLQEGYRESQQS